MRNLNDLEFFVVAVEQGGFAAAARRLDVPKSTVSKRVAELEGRLEARLIHRTSRSFTLTELGRDFYEHARAALIEADAAEEAVRRRMAEPSGTVRISASIPTAQNDLAPVLPQLAQRFPRLRLQLEVSDRFVDVVQEGIDIAVRNHFAPLPDSGLLQRPIRVEPIVLVAAPDYLQRQEALSSPAQLEHQDGVMTGATQLRWRLTGPQEQSIEVAPRPRFIANESQLLLHAALAGLGITCLPETLCRSALQTGRLQQVLPGWEAGRVTTTLVMPHRRGQLPGVRAVVDFLVDCLGRA